MRNKANRNSIRGHDYVIDPEYNKGHVEDKFRIPKAIAKGVYNAMPILIGIALVAAAIYFLPFAAAVPAIAVLVMVGGGVRAYSHWRNDAREAAAMRRVRSYSSSEGDLELATHEEPTAPSLSRRR